MIIFSNRIQNLLSRIFNIGNKHIQSKTRIFNNYSKNNFKFLNKNNADIDTATGEYIYPLQENKNAEYQQYGLLQEVYTRKKNITFSKTLLI